jgi:hypothetical protein
VTENEPGLLLQFPRIVALVALLDSDLETLSVCPYLDKSGGILRLGEGGRMVKCWEAECLVVMFDWREQMEGTKAELEKVREKETTERNWKREDDLFMEFEKANIESEKRPVSLYGMLNVEYHSMLCISLYGFVGGLSTGNLWQTFAYQDFTT